MAPDLQIDPKSGFCKSNSIFYSKRNPITLPLNATLDVATFSSSHCHRRTALIDSATGRLFSYTQFRSAVDAISSRLSEMGISKGDVVLLLSPNSIYFPLVCLAVTSLGAIITTANPLNTADEIATQIADSKPVIAFTIPELITKLSHSNLSVVLIGANYALEQLPTGVNVSSSLEEMMANSPTGNWVKDQVHQEDPATLLYSSGTTGPSKGVISSHLNIIAAATVVIERLMLQHTEDSVFLCTIPMFHIYGLLFVITLLFAGFTIVVLPKFDANEMLAAVSKYRVTFLPLVPPIIIGILNNAGYVKSKYDLSSVSTVLSGGASLSREIVEQFGDEFPNVKIQQAYGLTESTGIGASTELMEDDNQSSGAAGFLSASMEAMIVDPDSGKALSVNERGELWLRGPTIMKGYLGNLEATSSTLISGGWLRTGDLCCIDDNGIVFVVDRLKELIKYKGYQVAPAELEALLLTHPGIADAAVIPVPDKDVGQYPMAYVVPKDGRKLSETTILEFVATKVAPYKKIRRVVFTDSLPKTPSGKILRRNLVIKAAARL